MRYQAHNKNSMLGHHPRLNYTAIARGERKQAQTSLIKYKSKWAND